MVYLAAFLSVVVFLVAFWLLGIIRVAAKAIEVSRQSASTIRDPDLSDDDKERSVRQASLALLGGFLSILVRAAIATGASLVPILAFDAAGLAHIWDVVDFLATWEAIVLISVLLTLAILGWRRI